MNPTNPRRQELPENLDTTREASAFPGSENPRLLAAVQEYMAALDAGQQPSRQEFLTRYADIAEELAACLDSLTFLHSAAAQMKGSSATSAGSTGSSPAVDVATAQPLGDFKLVREIGRGGMGVVYEAMQLSLGRRVAVKVLPLAATLDARHLQRFRNEAQTAAQLHHTNIVPVYAVGCERSVHYYAMQLIAGQSLADVIRTLRAATGRHADKPSTTVREAPGGGPAPTVQRQAGSPGQVSAAEGEASESVPPLLPPGTSSATPAESLSLLHSSKRSAFFRNVAGLGLQAAEALEYAHLQGVVHRDIKPENLLLDVRGNLWITDFGLAQFYDADGGLTRTGDLLGTLRYMSPEQASGRAVVLDQRTDVYSLGLTLYELLTLERAIPGESREQLLRQIWSHEPRSPRSIDKALPPELETILSKAIAKDPADRYATAGALAEDFRRFLRDEPILAQPPSLWDKAVKWTRRHKSVAMSALAMLLLAAVGLLASTLLIANEQAKTKAAYERERSKATEAEQQRTRAEKSFKQAREAVDFFSRIAAEEMDKPEFGDVRRRMLEASLAYYQSFLEDRKDDPSISAELDAARSRVATILGELSAFDTFFAMQFRLRLLGEESVRKDLGLSPEQIDKAGKLAEDSFRRPPGGAFQDFRQMTSDEKRERFSAMAGALEGQLGNVLTPQQAARLRQICRQVQGPQAFSEPEVVQALSLTAEQRDRLRAIQAKSRDARFGPGPRGDPSGGGAERAKKEAIANILAQLTPAQAEAWKELTGEPFTGSVFSRDRPFGPPPGAPGGPPGGPPGGLPRRPPEPR